MGDRLAPGEGPNRSAALDKEIESMEAQIRELTDRKSSLVTSLLSSNATLEALNRVAPSALEFETAPIVLRSDKHADANRHRVAFSVTSFPFKDPSPHSDSPNLLGVRIDICARDGKFVKPYYLLLKRVGSEKKSLRVHRHTIPAFIPLRRLEERYLPTPRVESGDPENLKPRRDKKQDLERLVRELRRELVSWHLRCDAIAWLREEIGVSGTDTEPGVATDIQRDNASISRKFGILSMEATAIEARYVRIEWEDGRVGRIKISNRGFVERAIVIDDQGRDDSTAALFTGGDGRIETLPQRLSEATATG